MPRTVRSSKDFACRAGTSLLNRRVTLHRYDLTHRSYANRSARSRTLARAGRVFIFCFRPGTGAGPTVLDFLSDVHDLNDRSLVENLYKGRSARLGMHYSDLQSLRLVQDRRAAVVVDSFDANSFNFIILIILIIDLAKSFGKGVGFGIGLFLLGVIFFPILGFGSAQYQGPAAGSLGSGAATSRPPQPV